MLAVVAGFYIQDAIAFFSSHAQAEQQLSIVHHLVQDNKRLEREQQALNDPATIQRDARALGMVRPGERPYAIIGMSSH
ncbi:MAG: septum formation initiator family protein [Solirubrobacterales bacterium]|nr:septum formation initiator family protein [Solirubrobacterales bacterium]